MMKILHLNNQDIGGAAIASLRLHQKLQENGISSRYLAMDNHNDFDYINYVFSKNSSKYDLNYLFKRHLVPQFLKRRYGRNINTAEHYSFPYSMIDITKNELYKNADIIHFHNIAEFVDIPSFIKKNKKPIVVTLHDLYFLNGLLHIFEKNDLNNDTLLLMEKYKKLMEEFIKFDIKLVAPSNSVKKAAFRLNSGFTDKIEIIYHGIDNNKFLPTNKSQAKKKLKIETKGKTILLISDNFERNNKNFKIVIDKLAKSNNAEINLLAVGNNYEKIHNDLLPFISIPFSQDYNMNEIYSAADITIVPSLFETFSLVTLESISCGTPVVAFDNSGPSEIINHKENGYLAQFANYDDFINGIEYCIEKMPFNNSFKIDDEFNIDFCANRYKEIYSQLI